MFNLPERLKNLRKQKKLSLKKVGDAIGVSDMAISYYENGEREPDFEKLTKLAEFFEVPVSYLLGISNEIGYKYSVDDYKDVVVYATQQNVSPEQLKELIKVIKKINP
jgi:transcriptional regulator with XRE-family HTH domain